MNKVADQFKRSDGGRGRCRGRGRGYGRGGRGRGRARPNFTNNVSNSTTVTNCNTHMPVCVFFQQNRCNFGSNCRFYHPLDETNGAGGEDTVTPTPQLVQSDSFKSRVFDASKAQAITMAKNAQDMEPRYYEYLEGPFYSIDIECVATGYGHSKSHRYPCRVALVKDQDGEIETLLDEYVNLENIKVVSYMTELSGTSAIQCQGPETKCLNEIRDNVKYLLSADAILVGHSVQHDIEWLGLIKGIDFRDYFDTSIIFRQRIPKNLSSASNALKNASQESKEEISSQKTDGKEDEGRTKETAEGHDDSNLPFPTRYRSFSLRHCCLNLLDTDIQSAAHDPVTDAKYSLVLFQKYKNAPTPLLRAVRDSLHRSRPTTSFASENPVVDGVCLSANGYKMKRAARIILAWWKGIKKSS